MERGDAARHAPGHRDRDRTRGHRRRGGLGRPARVPCRQPGRRRGRAAAAGPGGGPAPRSGSARRGARPDHGPRSRRRVGADSQSRGAGRLLPGRRRPDARHRPHRHPRARDGGGPARHPPGPPGPGGAAPGGCPAAADVRRHRQLGGPASDRPATRSVTRSARHPQSRRAAPAGHGGPRPRAHRPRLDRDPAVPRTLCAGSDSPGGGSGHETVCSCWVSSWPCGGSKEALPPAGRNRPRAHPIRRPWWSRTPSRSTLPLSLPAQLYVEHDAALYARSAGIIETILADLGSRVEAGQLLARLESTDQEIALAQARERHANARPQVERHRALKTAGGVTQADSERVELRYREAELALQKAQRDFELTRVTAPFAGRRHRAHRAGAAGWCAGRLALPAHRAGAPARLGAGARGGRRSGTRVGAEATVAGPRGERGRRTGGPRHPGDRRRPAAPARWCSSSTAATG